MKLHLTCRDVTKLVLTGEDRPLRWHERLGMRLHLLMCHACPRFVNQVETMRAAMRRWR